MERGVLASGEISEEAPMGTTKEPGTDVVDNTCGAMTPT